MEGKCFPIDKDKFLKKKWLKELKVVIVNLMEIKEFYINLFLQRCRNKLSIRLVQK